jgi:hypothetical protein
MEERIAAGTIYGGLPGGSANRIFSVDKNLPISYYKYMAPAV